jgi:hypothetical protein
MKPHATTSLQMESYKMTLLTSVNPATNTWISTDLLTRRFIIVKCRMVKNCEGAALFIQKVKCSVLRDD